MSDKYLPTVYQQVIAKSRYSRWRDDLGRRETWEETVDRYMKYVIMPHAADEPLFSEIRDSILNLKVMPSMRGLMCAGPALERDNMALYNPVSGDTLVLTKEHGNVPIESLEGKQATVLNKDGRWAEATFTGYGVQDVKTVVVRLNSNTVRKVKATANHRWLLADGSVVSTDELQPGHKIPFVLAPKPAIDADYYLGIKHGLIYGDGTAVRSSGRVNGYMIRLCGDSRELLPYLADYPVTYPPSYDGDPVVCMYDTFAATHCLKQLPLEGETDSYLLGFVRGWFAADGTVSSTSQASICVQDAGKDWLLKNAERVGIVPQSVYEHSGRTNYGQRTRRQWSVRISRSSLTEEDMLCSWKKEKLKELDSHYVVQEVRSDGLRERVYCASVEDTNTFVLSTGLVTGNCGFLVMDNPRAFDEILYILTCGTGVGFSCETQYINKLPEVSEEFHDTDSIIVVADSRIGWASSFREHISLLYSGKIAKVDVSKVRPKGERLKVFGGRASGPEPLVNLFDYATRVFRGAAGRRLTDLEVHGLVCKIGEVVVVGGVRRSALISLSDLHSTKMRSAKNGNWWERFPEFALANNSAVYEEKPDTGSFLTEWNSLYESKSGERGIYYRKGIRDKTDKIGRRDSSLIIGTNPCGEIALRSAGLCNLTEIVCRSTDTIDELKRKARIATIIGTIQSTYTNFRYVKNIWKRNAEEERLLGVSLTGIYDNTALSGGDGPGGMGVLAELLEGLKEYCGEVNREFAARLGINPSVAISTIKPSGTVSQLVDSASGIHPRHSNYYIRSIRQDNKDPLTQFLKDNNVPNEPDVTKPDATTVFYFPVKSPDGAVVRDQVNPRKHLDLWNVYNTHWAEHQVSVTVSVKENEWVDTAGWVFGNFDSLSGVSFLPMDGGTYRQAPYQDCTKEQYEELLSKMPKSIDWEAFAAYESDDNTTSTREFACVGNSCEVL